MSHVRDDLLMMSHGLILRNQKIVCFGKSKKYRAGATHVRGLSNVRVHGGVTGSVPEPQGYRHKIRSKKTIDI